MVAYGLAVADLATDIIAPAKVPSTIQPMLLSTQLFTTNLYREEFAMPFMQAVCRLMVVRIRATGSSLNRNLPLSELIP
jgi:hypothetical protein